MTLFTVQKVLDMDLLFSDPTFHDELLDLGPALKSKYILGSTSWSRVSVALLGPMTGS